MCVYIHTDTSVYIYTHIDTHIHTQVSIHILNVRVYIYIHIGDISYVHGFWAESTKNRPRKHFQASQAAEPDVVPGLGSQGAAHK